MATNVAFTIIDYDGEKSVWSVDMVDIANDGSNFPNILQAALDLFTDWKAILRCDDYVKLAISTVLRQSNLPATDPSADRENKWHVSYEDATQFLDDPLNLVPNPGYRKLFSSEIPTADLSIREDHSETIYTTAGGGLSPAVTDAVNEFNSSVRSPYGGNALVVKVVSVGRDL